MEAVIILFSIILVTVRSGPEDDFVSGNNIFTADIYREIAKTNKGNILVSPLSAEIIVALAQSGAIGETAQEIRTTLRLPNTTEEIESSLKAILPSLKGDEQYSLHTANKIYLKENFAIKDNFKKLSDDIYSADVENIDFLQKTQAATTMNKWVEKHTENKIHDLISSNDLDDKTVAILINALYFKGTWEDGFSNASTSKQKFYKAPEETVEVNTMHSDYKQSYIFEDKALDAQFLELPFLGRDVSMIIALPNKKNGISTLENQLDKVFAPRSYHLAHVNVAIPKFKIENTLDFKDILMNLGVTKAFNAEEADFSGVAGKKGDIYVKIIRQKAFMDVNEAGVEAAAATFLGWSYEFGGEPVEFVADHPFIFYIKYKNLVLFAGRVSEPQQ